MITRTAKLLDGITRTAIFSDDMKYRFRLDIIWDKSIKPVMFVMLNPSTATEEQNDPTVTRCERRAREMKTGGVIITNLFAYRATDPNELKNIDPKIDTEENIQYILEAAKQSSMIVCGWGLHGRLFHRSIWIESALRNHCQLPLHVLKLTKGDRLRRGEPAHPLYLSYSLQPEIWEL